MKCRKTISRFKDLEKSFNKLDKTKQQRPAMCAKPMDKDLPVFSFLENIN